MNKIQIIIFSGDRAMQLQLLLASIKRNVEGLDKVIVSYNYSNDKFLEGYKKLIGERLIDEVSCQQGYYNTPKWRDYFIKLLGIEYPYTCIICDDSAVFRKFSMQEIIPCMTEDVFSFSLSFGLNVRYIYFGNVPVPRRFKDYEDLGKFVKWDWRRAECYPLALDGYIYRTKEFIESIKKVEGSGINQLESHLFNTARKDITRPNMASFKHSVVISMPVNRIQTDFPNHFGEKFSFSREELNEAYLKGYIVDFDKMDFSDIKAAHQELDFPLTLK